MKIRLHLKAFVRAVLLLALGAMPVFASPVSLEGATFGYARTSALRSYIGSLAIPTSTAYMRVGGVAFVRPATGDDGWKIVDMAYAPGAADGSRVSVVLSHPKQSTYTTVPARLWDWEVVPLARFVASPTDSAFTYFGELEEGVKPTLSGADAVSYHSAFKNTLMGLRFMQLDLMLFAGPAFSGFFTDSSGNVILGGGEQAALGNVSLNTPAQRKAARDAISQRIESSFEIFAKDCKANPSATCRESEQPFQSYIVGDMITPVSFSVKDGALQLKSAGVCWDFWRETEPGEAPSAGLTDIRLLRNLSREFCMAVQKDPNHLHPLVYRTALRAMRYSALLRSFKNQSPAAFNKFVGSLQRVTPLPQVDTPTEIRVATPSVSPADAEELLRRLQELQRNSRRQ